MAIIRTKSVCGGCFIIIKKDNKLRMKERKEIPKSPIVLKETREDNWI